MAASNQSFPFPPHLAANGQSQPILRPYSNHGANRQLLQLDTLNTTSIGEQTDAFRSAQSSNPTSNRLGPAIEHVKFRRTRSGCYVCRNRRVKCDEARPVCERCRKGGRECVYPERSSSGKYRRDSTKSKSIEGDVSSQDDGEGKNIVIERDNQSPVPASAEPQSATSTESTCPYFPTDSDSPALIDAPSPTSSTNGTDTLARMNSSTSLRRAAGLGAQIQGSGHRIWAELPGELRFYLQFSRTNLTYHHLGLKIDAHGFMSNTLIEVALKFEPLLYAVVGFAAYHYTLTKPDGRLHDFLGYYQKSVELLRHSFKKKPTIATVMTILQLATIEEFLGDWVNMMSHQKAAHMLITDMYTPQTMLENDTLRKVLQWFSHFDTFVGILSGTGTQLGSVWLETQISYFKEQADEFPADLVPKYEERWAWIRLTGHAIAKLFRDRARGAVPEMEYQIQVDILRERVSQFRSTLHPALRDPAHLVANIAIDRDPDYNSIVDPFEPNLLFGGTLFRTNLLMLDFYGFELIFNSQLDIMEGRKDPEGSRRLALKMCQIFEATQLSSPGGIGTILGMHAGLALAVLFLGPDEAEIMWARKKFASIEAQGYTYPATLRARLEEVWGVDMSHWWLPNDEGLPFIITQIRSFITSNPVDQKGEDLRDMKGLFDALNLSDTSSIESSHQGTPIEYGESIPSRQSSGTG